MEDAADIPAHSVLDGAEKLIVGGRAGRVIGVRLPDHTVHLRRKKAPHTGIAASVLGRLEAIEVIIIVAILHLLVDPFFCHKLDIN